MNAIAGFFGSILKYILDFTGSYGLSIILFTILVKLLLTPLAIKQTKSTFAMSTINPKIKEIQEKYKNKPEKQNEEIAKLYKESDINPLSGCLPLLVQLPILYALFFVFKNPVQHGVFESQAVLSSSAQFLWIKSFVKPDYILAFLSGISALGMMFITTPRDQMKGPMMPMLIMMPLLSFWWGFTFPAALTLYWTISNLFQALQYIVITKPLKDKLEREKSSENKFDAKVSGRK